MPRQLMSEICCSIQVNARCWNRTRASFQVRHFDWAETYFSRGGEFLFYLFPQSRREQHQSYTKSTFPAPVALFIRPYQEKIILGIILGDRWVDKILAVREVIGGFSRIVIFLVVRLQS